MKRIGTMVISLLFCANTFAQNNFYSSYDFANRNDGGNSISQLSNAGFITFGQTTRGGYAGKFLKIDSVGNLIYNKHYLVLFDDMNGGRILNDSVYYGYGSHFNQTEGASDSHIMLIKSNGDSLKTQLYNLAFNDRIHDLHLKQNGTFVAYGFYTDTLPNERKPFIANIDTAGNVLWFKTHSKNNHDAEIKNLQPTADGGYVFSGTEEENPNGHTDLFLTKVDSNGNLVWKKYYHEAYSQRGGHVEVLKDGNYALFGTGYTPHNADRAILKIDTAGNLIWRKKNGTNQDEGYIVGRELPNGNFICAGTSIRTHNGVKLADDVHLSMLDSLGNVLWSRDYNYHGGNINEYVKDLIVTSDGGFAMTGFILNAPGGTGNDVFVLKTDANGFITSVNSGFYEVTPQVQVYPNPTTGLVVISSIEGLEKIEVYSADGNLLQQEIRRNDSRNENHIDLSGYQKGVYVFKLIMNNGEVKTAKIVKE